MTHSLQGQGQQSHRGRGVSCSCFFPANKHTGIYFGGRDCYYQQSIDKNRSLPPKPELRRHLRVLLEPGQDVPLSAVYHAGCAWMVNGGISYDFDSVSQKEKCTSTMGSYLWCKNSPRSKKRKGMTSAGRFLALYKPWCRQFSFKFCCIQ